MFVESQSQGSTEGRGQIGQRDPHFGDEGAAEFRLALLSSFLPQVLASRVLNWLASLAQVIVEEFLEGEEVSFFALVDGQRAVPLASAQDHKRVGEGDTGPNTGGMGAYSPSPLVTPAMEAQVGAAASILGCANVVAPSRFPLQSQMDQVQWLCVTGMCKSRGRGSRLDGR